MRARVFTALALIPPVLAAVFCTDAWPILGLCILLTFLAASEINRLLKGRFAVVGAFLWITLAFASSWFKADQKLDYKYLCVAGTVALAIGILAARRAARHQSSSPLLDMLAGGWVAGPICAILGLHGLTAGATPPWFRLEMPLLLAIVPLWAGDTAAIFAVKAFGKHPLAPEISPKKTIEGGVANLVACMLAAWGLGTWLQIPVVPSLLCGAAAGVFGQLGDLFESWVKRRADLKDSGALLPGHGGIMDRIDSILFTAPVVSMILLFWSTSG
ncbi:MAG: phosphatidate cytidylyltransferase [Fimbriimonadaceae bacterium]|nr:phosphatidate cytidylyltransferase [Fimbriimonadaceae bacterium]